MINNFSSNEPRLDIIIQRKLEVITSGNSAYLETFLTAAKNAGLSVRVVFAPWRSFENRPWAGVHQRFDNLIDEIVWPSSIKIGRIYWSIAPRIWGRFAIRICKEVLRRAGFKIQIPTYFSVPLGLSERNQISALLRKNLADITVAEYSSLGTVLAEIPNDQTIHAVLMHDVLSDRGAALRAGGVIPNFDEVSAEEEASWIATSKLNIYASRNEMETFGFRVPGAHNVWLRPHVPQFSLPPETKHPRIVFIGTQHAGNIDAIEHFYESIWPMIRQEIPEAKLYIAGSTGAALPNYIQSDESISILGRVDDLAELGGPQSVTIAPTRIATGVSIKVAEYLLLRTACVAYPSAIQGFGGALDGLLEVCDTEESFAEAVIALYNDKNRRQTLANAAGDAAPDRLANTEVVMALQSAVEGGRE